MGDCLLEVHHVDPRDHINRTTLATWVGFNNDKSRVIVQKADGGELSINIQDIGYIQPATGDSYGGLSL